MSNYSNFVSCITQYCILKGFPINVEQGLSAASIDTEHTWQFNSIYADLSTISMDTIAQQVVRPLNYKNSKWKKDSPASFDSFLIDKAGNWYFIEFKNQKVSRTKEKCIEKSYANIYWLLQILNEMKEQGNSIDFNYENPHTFFKEKCHFILVLSKGADPLTIGKLRQTKLTSFDCPEQCLFLKKLEAYIFKTATIMDENQFDRNFVQNFHY